MDPMKQAYKINISATALIICSLAQYGCSTAHEPHETLSSQVNTPVRSAADTGPAYPETPQANLPDDTNIITARSSATVAVRTLKLRRGHGLGYSSNARLHRGDTLEVLKVREDGWVEIRTSDGLTGWAWGPLLKIQGRKYITEKYKGMTHILVSRNQYLGPDGRLRGLAELRGLRLRPPLYSIQLTSKYGIRKHHPVNGGRNKMHAGVDLLAEVGTAVRSSAHGIIARVSKGKHYGNFVDVKHRLGFTTRYAHMSRTLVRKGQKVKAGQVIGLSGNTGATTGPHLHFELHRNGRTVRPGTYISALN